MVAVREKRVRAKEYRSGAGAALAVRPSALGVLLALALAPAGLGWRPAPAHAQTAAPAVRFHVGAEELVAAAGTGASGDARAVEDRAGDLVEWWEEKGPEFLARVGNDTGLPWPYRDIEVYLVRSWPVLSIEYPLVLAVGSVGEGPGSVEVPGDTDFQVLVLAHQLTHYLLDDPEFVPQNLRPTAYEHPFLAPGNLEAEAMMNWVVYTVLEEMWGRERLAKAAGREMWRDYNPNHAYVVDELMPRWALGPTSTLVQWLASHPRGSEIFRIHDAYARQLATPEATPDVRGNLTGTEYGIDLGASFEGRIFVALVDPSSPADRAGARRDDVIATIEGRPPGNDVVEAKRRLDQSWRDNGEINLSVLRDGREIFLTIGRR